MSKIEKAAREYVARINANVAEYMADRIDHKTFSARQGATWAELYCAGAEIDRRVLEILRTR